MTTSGTTQCLHLLAPCLMLALAAPARRRIPDCRAPQTPELYSWKEIASYLGVSVRTAQLFELERGLPVPAGREEEGV